MTLSVAMPLLLSAFGILLVLSLPYGSSNNISYGPQISLASQMNIIADEDDSLLPSLYNKTASSVVSITTKINPGYLNGSALPATPNTAIDVPLAQGSGFVYNKQGHIVTNYHVLRGGTSADVRFLDGNSYSATLVGKDPYSDLAVLKLDSTALYNQQLVPLTLGNSSLKVGQHVVAIGNPYGYTGTMTEGIVSQLNLVLPNQQTGSLQSGMIQIDVPITHGNSGGPLLNLAGQVVGVTSGGSELQGANFINWAIPSDMIARVVPQLISNGKYENVWLGISGVDIIPDIAKALGLNQPKGVVVTYVTPNSPGYTSGISAGNPQNTLTFYGINSRTIINSDADVIIGIDGKQVRQLADLLNYIDTKSVDDKVALTIVRNKIVQNVDVTLTERPSPS